MSRLYQQSEGTAAYRRFPIPLLVDATDGITAETGEAGGQPQISKIGGAWANTGGVLVDTGTGSYYVILTAAELDTLGMFMIRYKSANTASFAMDGQVVPWDPYDAVRGGFTSLPNANADGPGGLVISDAGGLDIDAAMAKLGTPAADISADIAAVKAETATIYGQTTAIKANTDNLPSAVKKNTALNNFEVLMVLAADHATAATGLTVACARSIDGGAFAASTNTPCTEVSNGIYKINLSAADLNGDVITFRFSVATADDRMVTIITEP